MTERGSSEHGPRLDEEMAREVASLRMAVGEVATRDYLRSELRSLLAEIEERAQSHPREIHAEGGSATPST